MSGSIDNGTGKYGTRGSVSKAQSQGDELSTAEAAEQNALFKLCFIESLDDPQVSTKLQKIMQLATKTWGIPWGRFVMRSTPWNSN